MTVSLLARAGRETPPRHIYYSIDSAHCLRARLSGALNHAHIRLMNGFIDRSGCGAKIARWSRET
jgi:hypothetical protein